MKYKILCTLYLVFCTNILLSQTPPYHHYTSVNGLPSSTVYDLIQDKSGYIWIATNNGLSRFDGSKFNNYGIIDGLNSSTIVSVLEGDQGEIYIGNLEKGINLFKNGKITSYTLPNPSEFRIGDIFFDKNKLYAHSVDGFLISYSNGMSEIVSALNALNSLNELTRLTYKIRKITDGTICALTSNGIYGIHHSNLKKINIQGLENAEIYNIFEEERGNVFAGGKGNIYEINNYKVIKTIRTDEAENKINSIFKDSRGNIWFSVLNKGFRVIYAGSDKIFNISDKLKIGKTPVNKFIEDNEGNVWISTFGRGIFCLNNLHIKNYNEDDGLSNSNVQALEKDNLGRLIVGTFNGINILENGKFKIFKFGNDLTDYVYELNFLNNKIYTCATGSRNEVINTQFNNLEFVICFGVSFCLTNNSNYLLGAWGNNYYKNKDLSKIYEKYYSVFGNEFKNNRINKIFEDSEGDLWFGTTLGACKMKDSIKTIFPDNIILNSNINSIKEDGKKSIWFAGEKGIANYNLKTSEITSYINFNNYDLSSSTSVAFDSYNRTWIGNTKGLFILNKDSIQYFNTQTGLPSNEILTLFSDKERNIMWIGTSNGFSSFDINFFNNYKQQSLNIKIDEVKSGDSIYTNNNNLEFEPENNNIFVSFSALNFSSPSTLIYQYKLEDEWIDVEGNFLDFSSMKEGIYNLSLRAKMQNSPWGEPAFLTFLVKPKFTETFWFQLLIFLLASGIILSIAKYRINQNKKKNINQLEITKRMNELKHQALSAMMNPHFIFNSLNSVQYLVNKDRKVEANDYIAMMGKLIRKNLDIAGNSFILLKEEIERLTLYLEIEKLRFQDKFIYEFDISNDVNIESISIPNMIIQPFVENAVWHGIMNIDKTGLVKVSFGFEDVSIDSNIYKCLILKITDNGVGYINSKETKKEGHISKGIKIIEERLKILSHDLNLPQPVLIEDLSLRSQNSSGTEVIISLPPTLYKITAT